MPEHMTRLPPRRWSQGDSWKEAMAMHASWQAQGAQLEPDLGSGRFLALVAELLALSHGATVALAALGARLLPDLAGAQYYEACGVGFSAVLFALKVVLSHRTPGWSSVCGVPLPTKARAGCLPPSLLTPGSRCSLACTPMLKPGVMKMPGCYPEIRQWPLLFLSERFCRCLRSALTGVHCALHAVCVLGGAAVHPAVDAARILPGPPGRHPGWCIPSACMLLDGRYLWACACSAVLTQLKRVAKCWPAGLLHVYILEGGVPMPGRQWGRGLAASMGGRASTGATRFSSGAGPHFATRDGQARPAPAEGVRQHWSQREQQPRTSGRHPVSMVEGPCKPGFTERFCDACISSCLVWNLCNRRVCPTARRWTKLRPQTAGRASTTTPRGQTP